MRNRVSRKQCSIRGNTRDRHKQRARLYLARIVRYLADIDLGNRGLRTQLHSLQQGLQARAPGVSLFSHSLSFRVLSASASDPFLFSRNPQSFAHGLPLNLFLSAPYPRVRVVCRIPLESSLPGVPCCRRPAFVELQGCCQPPPGSSPFACRCPPLPAWSRPSCPALRCLR